MRCSFYFIAFLFFKVGFLINLIFCCSTCEENELLINQVEEHDVNLLPLSSSTKMVKIKLNRNLLNDKIQEEQDGEIQFFKRTGSEPNGLEHSPSIQRIGSIKEFGEPSQITGKNVIASPPKPAAKQRKGIFSTIKKHVNTALRGRH